MIQGAGKPRAQESSRGLTDADYRALGDFRYQIRRFLYFSEQASRAEGLEPQQQQMLLAIRVLDEPGGPSIGALAEFLLIRHHSAVGLVDRLARRKLVERVRSATDRRQVRVKLMPAGEIKLKRLSGVHRQELRRSGPALVDTLRGLLQRLSADVE